MKKIITTVLLAMLGTVANAQTFTFKAEAVSFDKEGVSVYGNTCSTVQAQYIEYFTPTKKQLKEYKEGTREGWEFDSQGRAFTSELVAPSVFGGDKDAQAELAKTAIKDGAYLDFNIQSKTCTLVVKSGESK